MLLAATISIACASGVVASKAEAKNQEAKATSSDIDGQQLFATTCGWCHANGGRTAGKGPKLAGTKRSDAFITNRIKNGKEGAMPAFGGTFDDNQIKEIIT